MKNSSITAVSLFSGCGGFDWGAHQAGAEIIWANDNNPHAAAAYKSLFPKVGFVQDDIRNIQEIPRADILIGCYPCTGFSVAARRRWKERQNRDLRQNHDNFLYKEFVRALKQVQPKYFFVENVRGMASATNGWFLQKQIREFKACGYRVEPPTLLDASGFGVPQTRKRIFIIGVRRDIAFDYKFPNPSHGPGCKKQHVLLKDKIAGMPEWPEGDFFDFQFHGHYLTRNRKRSWHELSYTIVANAHHVPLHPMGLPMKFVAKDKWALQGNQNRRLSWRECAAVQGLPSHLAPSGRLVDKYKVIGNGVPPALGKALLTPIVNFESGNYGRHR